VADDYARRSYKLVLHTPTQGRQRGTPQNLLDMVDRLRDLTVPQKDLRVNVSSMGPTQLPITIIGLAMGLNVRVGMEDNVLYRRGEPVENNAQLVERTMRIAHELGLYCGRRRCGVLFS
jgi:3-keto-5-aminohexanoate cleavage enzyme